ncbi:hypothetical protein NM688_g8951 [Phlebia brevispora]|uniref:Uncharacterized protein n=1 Tax=Phlebia brevispora TaxID=194682 RepID=A0ACC1RN55_9APHY|nr:hypothetical protein NM688_g8951 [Phlebia brevispora]
MWRRAFKTTTTTPASIYTAASKTEVAPNAGTIGPRGDEGNAGQSRPAVQGNATLPRSADSEAPDGTGQDWQDPGVSPHLKTELDPSSQALVDAIIQGLRTIRAEGTNGWAEISNALNDVDAEKLEHCKDDIDTLLVFAGLFSAVLTAFVVESYTSLSPDPTDAMIQLLMQISIQTSSYTITPSFMNATTSPVLSLAFQPNPTAVIVNRFWFISLILSLITASFGILIKQWLREYKAVDSKHSSLRNRLRIRQFRYPALLKWKVFELVACLPLLIQVALGLFLLGLCFFTWNINPSIGRSCTVLVSAWIFFFTATVFAPTFSSACPYKSPFFNPFLRRLRGRLCHFRCLSWIYVGPKAADRRLRQYDHVALVVLWQLICISCETIRSVGRWISAIMSTRERVRGQVHTQTPGLKIPHAITSIPLEETEVAADEQRELDILATVDDVLVDDELLGAGMRSIISRSLFGPEEIVNFIRQVLLHRSPKLRTIFPDPDQPFTMTDLRTLSSRAWAAVTDIIVRPYEVTRSLDSQQHGWMKHWRY